jgi:hypothetical protein
MATADTICKVNDALHRLRGCLLYSQRPDGTWIGPIESDPRPTAFYLTTIGALGREPDNATREMERYLLSEQLDCGAWQAWPGGGPDIDYGGLRACLEKRGHRTGEASPESSAKMVVRAAAAGCGFFLERTSSVKWCRRAFGGSVQSAAFCSSPCLAWVGLTSRPCC